MERRVIDAEPVTLAPGAARLQFTRVHCHSPQEPAVPQAVLAPTDPRARPQEARQLPFQHHRGGHDLEAAGRQGKKSERAMRFRERRRPPTERTLRHQWDEDTGDRWR